MATIARVEIRMVDLKPKVKRVDAIQSFVSQETPFVRITDSDGAVGVGYSYTIGTGGPAIVELLARSLAPALLGRDGAQVEKIWRDLLFLTHATSVGAITSLALAAIDTALWDLRCRKAGLPLHVMDARLTGQDDAEEAQPGVLPEVVLFFVRLRRNLPVNQAEVARGRLRHGVCQGCQVRLPPVPGVFERAYAPEGFAVVAGLHLEAVSGAIDPRSIALW